MMADENMEISDKGTTIDAELFKLPTESVPSDKQQEQTEEEQSESKPNQQSSTHGSNGKQRSQLATYDLENFQEHAMLIFNHENIIGYKPRLGSEQDVKALCKTFTRLGFRVTTHKDLTREMVLQELQKFCSRDFTNVGCVAVAVLTHGSKNGDLSSSDGSTYNERDIIKYLRCSNNMTLVGKPRILMIQACRGFGDNISNTRGVTVFETENTSETPEVSFTPRTTVQEEETKHYSLPLESNMLVVHSSYLGKNSFRNIVDGSWLIQALCSKINELAPSVDLNSILTEIKREVAIERQYTVYNKVNYENETLKQMPVTTSTLTRKLYLKHSEKPYARFCKDSSESVSGGPPTTKRANQGSATDAALLIQYGPCFCFLDRFNYMLNCLRCYLKNHPDDIAAMMCYNVAIEFQNGPAFYGTKEKMLKSISKCLNKSTTFKYHKYMHFYN